jgi:hypothetical protein
MKTLPNFTAISVLIISVVMFSTCGKRADISVPPPENQNNLPDQNIRSRELPNLQAEILDTKNTLTTSPILKTTPISSRGVGRILIIKNLPSYKVSAR